MKMRSISTLLVKGIVLVSFIYAGSVSPSVSMRFGDVLANDLPTPTTVLGLQVEVGDGVFAGIDSDAGDHRLFVKLGYGTFGMGTNSDGEPQFTIGGHYSVFKGFSVNMDYVINQLTDDGAGAPDPDVLRVSLGVNF
jgi:hypothetical protein